MVAASKAFEGSRLAMYGASHLEHCVACGRADDLDLCGLSRSGRRAFGSSRIQRSLRRPAEDVERAGASFERSFDRPIAAAAQSACVARGDRLAFGALLWSAQGDTERALLRQAASWNHKVSCLCLGMHCRVRATVHAGADLGAASRD